MKYYKLISATGEVIDIKYSKKELLRHRDIEVLRPDFEWDVFYSNMTSKEYIDTLLKYKIIIKC